MLEPGTDGALVVKSRPRKYSASASGRPLSTVVHHSIGVGPPGTFLATHPDSDDDGFDDMGDGL